MLSDTTYLANAFLASTLCVLALQRPAARIGLVDVPGGRKEHVGAIPLIGGIAMFIGFVFASALLVAPIREHWNLFAATLLLVLLGVADDRFEVPAPRKLVGQALAAGILVLPEHLLISEFRGPFGAALELPASLSLALTLVFVVGIVNAVNMMDGLDGLAGGTAVTALLWLVVGATIAGHPDLTLLALLLAFSVLGFLVFNIRHPWRKRAAVFMGDAGSMMLGAAIAYFVLSLSGGPERPLSFVALLWICAIPAIDTLSLMLRRSLAGRSPLSADREHLHHLLMRLGLSPADAAAAVIIVNAVLGGMGIAGAAFGISDTVMAVGLLAMICLHTLVVRRAHGCVEPSAPRALAGSIEQPAAGSVLRTDPEVSD